MVASKEEWMQTSIYLKMFIFKCTTNLWIWCSILQLIVANRRCPEHTTLLEVNFVRISISVKIHKIAVEVQRKKMLTDHGTEFLQIFIIHHRTSMARSKVSYCAGCFTVRKEGTQFCFALQKSKNLRRKYSTTTHISEHYMVWNHIFSPSLR